MHAFPQLRNFIFRVRYGFRGVPIRIQNHDIRFDESLRRWNFQSESQVQELLIKHVRPGDCVVDVGANFGIHAMLAGVIVGKKGEVHAFEPLERNLSMLRRHVTLNGLEKNVHVIPSAVSNSTASELVFFSGEEEVAVTASLKPSQPNAKTTKVPNLRLDDYPDLAGRTVRLIKIDVEGAELDVLRGAEKLLRSQKPLLVIEVHAFAFPDFNVSMKDFQQFLSSLGYEEEILPGTTLREGSHYQGFYKPSNNGLK